MYQVHAYIRDNLKIEVNKKDLNEVMSIITGLKLTLAGEVISEIEL